MAELQLAELVPPSPPPPMDAEAGRDQHSSTNEDCAQHADGEDGNIFGNFLFTKTGQMLLSTRMMIFTSAAFVPQNWQK